MCENYRPISLLSVGYKIFSALILGRLKDGGAENRLSKTQYGFRKGYGTEDAIFIARRKIELAWAQRDGHLLILALDWAKAFDSIDPEGMLAALRRFGLPEHLISVIAAIYSDRCFHVKDCGHISEKRAQHSGISQGCPLFPNLWLGFSEFNRPLLLPPLLLLHPPAKPFCKTPLLHSSTTPLFYTHLPPPSCIVLGLLPLASPLLV